MAFMLFVTTVFLGLVNKNLTARFTRIKFFSASAGIAFTAVADKADKQQASYTISGKQD